MSREYPCVVIKALRLHGWWDVRICLSDSRQSSICHASTLFLARSNASKLTSDLNIPVYEVQS